QVVPSWWLTSGPITVANDTELQGAGQLLSADVEASPSGSSNVPAQRSAAPRSTHCPPEVARSADDLRVRQGW
uniref:hypothetical protein n=1 Tax=uncultured Corynebacterium sp. TaxID=159447 RepID=UPI002594B069